MKPNLKTCDEKIDFQAYFDQQATLPERTRIDRHLRQCAACRVEFAVWRNLFEVLRNTYAQTPSDRPTAAEITAFVAKLAGHGGKAAAPAVAEPSVSAPAGSLFGMIAELIRLQRWLAAGLATCFALVVLMAFHDRGLPHAPASAPASNADPHRPAAESASKPFYTYRLSAPPGQGLRLPGAQGSPALPVEGSPELGVTYRVPPLGILFVSFHGENRIMFTSQAQFMLTATGTQLLTGQVTCDLHSSGSGFSVMTSAGSVTGLGGQFLVEARPAASRITLDTGSVMIRTGRLSATMDSPGSRFMMADGSVRLDAGDTTPRPLAAAAGLTVNR
ncbi:MAG TPA: zf-HC2 domain-containing protein [Candidatus Ozemobacteraceae bacterium]|nr:zf-HC2 domain-containing protein [Candidatus Ozemobacteraceae bacterium]